MCVCVCVGGGGGCRGKTQRKMLQEIQQDLLTTYYLNVLLTQLLQKNGYDFNGCNNVRVILYNTDVITAIVKLTVHSPVGKLVNLLIYAWKKREKKRYITFMRRHKTLITSEETNLIKQYLDVPEGLLDNHGCELKNVEHVDETGVERVEVGLNAGALHH